MRSYRWLPLLLQLLLLLPLPLLAEESITDYFSLIQVQPDGSMIVEEQITVRAEGQQIRRGIYRDFPTDYRGRFGNIHRVGFELLGVARDGVSEPHRIERHGNGVRIYAGDPDVMISHGIHEYSVRYRTDRQLGFFDDHDELYWNVTGNGWNFPIEQTAARVVLPGAIPAAEMRIEGYTGPEGDKGRDYLGGIEGDSRATIQATRPLAPGEGLTLVVSWPKGHLQEPPPRALFDRFLEDNPEAGIMGGGVALLLTYYLLMWLRVGRDPPGGVIIPLYAPPDGFSPAAARFIRRMGYDKKAFTAALTNMAVKGYIRIEEDAAGDFTLHKTGEPAALAPGEGAIAAVLFKDGDKFHIRRQHHLTLAHALKVHERRLKQDYEKRYFLTNGSYLLPGVLISIALLIGGVLAVPGGERQMITAFMAVWLSGWSLGVAVLLVAVVSAWRQATALGVGKAIFLTLFALPFFGGEIFGIGLLLYQGSAFFALALVSMIAINYLFYQWLKAPTLLGRRLLDKLEGFHLYLSVAEKDELAFRHPPDKTPQLFEAYLPYAIALDVEQRWADRFSGLLTDRDGQAVSPRWYRGYHGHSYGALAGALSGAMSNAISSSSTAPGSSSGGGGGGSSGGGGGGGGGGGW